MRISRIRVAVVGWIAVAACTQPPDPAGEQTTPATAETSDGPNATFMNRVWSVAERSDGGDAGSLYVFLSDGTLVISSPNARPALGRWRAEGAGLIMVEEGIEYNVDVLGITADEFRIRSHNPGQPLEIRFVPATGAPDDLVGSDAAPSPGAPHAQGAAASFQVPDAVAGRLLRGETGLRFVPCGEAGNGRAVHVAAQVDASAMIAGLGDGDAAAVILRLEGDTVTAIRYAGPAEVTCERLLPDAVVEARGNEPFWMLAVLGDTALFRTPEQQDGVPYVNGQWTRTSESSWRYDAVSAAGDSAGTGIRLELAEAECSDSMSGARHPFRAVLVRGTDRLEGCALEGRRAM